MDNHVLLDTSAWIVGFRKRLSLAVKESIERLLSEKRVVITQLIILELLTGASDQKEYNELYEDFTALKCVDITTDIWQDAYKISFDLRRRGYIIPSVDIIISSLCLKHGYLLLHTDRHYEIVKKYYPLQTRYIK